MNLLNVLSTSVGILVNKSRHTSKGGTGCSTDVTIGTTRRDGTVSLELSWCFAYLDALEKIYIFFRLQKVLAPQVSVALGRQQIHQLRLLISNPDVPCSRPKIARQESCTTH